MLNSTIAACYPRVNSVKLIPPHSKALFNAHVDNKEIRRLNMLQLADEFGTIRELADRTDTPASYLSNLKNRVDNRGMGDDVARRFEEKLKKPHGWMDVLQTAQPAHPYQAVRDTPLSFEPRQEIVEIAVFDVAASMGVGAALPEHETVVDHIRLTRSWVNRNLPSASSTHALAVISAYGDSMQPTFNDGDILLVDRAISEVRLDAVYVLSFHDELYIKRIQRRPDGSIAVISDNKVYDPIIVEAKDKESLRVLGRVLYAWNGKKL